jgi:ADP-heptose:LPS heptosyltransferase
MKTVIFSPYAAKLRSGLRNAKNYAYWPELISILKSRGYHTIQLGVSGEERIFGADEFKQNLSFDEITNLVNTPDSIVMSVDSFLPHLCKHIKKKCIVLWGMSDPLIFGHPENINILKDRKFLRNKHDQWVFWENVNHNSEVFVTATEVISRIEKELK